MSSITASSPYSVSSVFGSSTMHPGSTPRAFKTSVASETNRSVTSTTAGIPRFASSVWSWTLHAVQAPQFARPTMATSLVATTSSSTAGGVSFDVGIRHSRTAATP
jgi:hypothetical protein